MKFKKIAFFNHKGGVSKTTTVFNVGWMLAEKGYKVLLVDADSQCNLTRIVLGQRKYNTFYKKKPKQNIKYALEPAFESQAKLIEALDCHIAEQNTNLILMPGHFELSEYDVSLSISFQLSHALMGLKNLPGSFNTLIEKTAQKYNVDYVLIDLNPSLSAINQDMLMISDYFIIPATPDYFSAMAIKSLAKILPRWEKWAKAARPLFKNAIYPMPFNTPKFLGTIVQNFNIKGGKPTSTFQEMIQEINRVVVNELVPKLRNENMTLPNELYMDKAHVKEQLFGAKNYCLAEISDFNTLIAKSQKHGIPVFALSDRQIEVTGNLLNTHQKSRNKFRKIFDDLTTQIIKMIENAESLTAVSN